jgi:hypothetical protein
VIFGLFGRKSGPARDGDRIWRSSARALAAIVAEAAAAKRALVLAHFRSTLDELAGAAAAKGHRTRLYADRVTASALASPSALATGEGIALALCGALPELRAATPASGDEVLVLVAEHHFLPEEDDRVLRYCEGLPLAVRLRFHASLDGPLLRAFAGGHIERIMAALQAPEDEAIEHAMVDRAIRSAQEKLARKATGNRGARSPEEWMMLNLPRDAP